MKAVEGTSYSTVTAHIQDRYRTGEGYELRIL